MFTSDFLGSQSGSVGPSKAALWVHQRDSSVYSHSQGSFFLLTSPLQFECLSQQLHFFSQPFLVIHREKVVLRPKAFFLPKVVLSFTLTKTLCLNLCHLLVPPKKKFTPLFGCGVSCLNLSLGCSFFQRYWPFSFLKVPIRDSLPFFPLLLGGLGSSSFKPIGLGQGFTFFCQSALHHSASLAFASSICFYVLQGCHLVFCLHVFYVLSDDVQPLLKPVFRHKGPSDSSWTASYPSCYSVIAGHFVVVLPTPQLDCS